MAYEAKTRPTDVSVADFIAAVENPQRRADAETLCALFEELSGEPPMMWGPSIIGFGRYHYRYDSGHEGEMCRVGFSPRKTELVLYVLGASTEQEAALARLGRHRTGKGCLYVKKLADVDMAVLEELIRAKIGRMAEAYPA